MDQYHFMGSIFSSLVHLYANFEMWVLSLLNSALKILPTSPKSALI